MSQHTLLSNRTNLTARASIDAIITYVRKQDRKISIAQTRNARAFILTKIIFILPPVLYLSWHLTMGYWRSIYPTNIMSSFVQANQQRMREYFVPEIYLKEREKRKIQIKLKQTEQLRTAWEK